MINRKSFHTLIFLNIFVLIVVIVVASYAYIKNKEVQTTNPLANNDTSALTVDKPVDVVPTATQPPEGNQVAQVAQVITPAATPAVVKDARCLITISGKTYDVTSLQNTHSGGDVFNCGTDMTSVFYSQHGSSMLRKMSRYLVN